MPRPDAPVLAVLAAAVVLLVVAAGRMVPFATEQREIVSSVPVPPPLFTISPVRVAPGRSACTDQVALDERSAIATVRTTPRARDIPPAGLTVRAGDYRARGRFGDGLGPHGDVLRATFEAPPGPRIATLCVRNRGSRTLELVGTEESRTSTRSRTTIAGLDQPDLAMTIYQQRAQSLLGAAPQILERAALYKAGFLRGWMLAPLALALFIGVPAAMIWALWHALRADDPPRVQ
jgi:hypothetical protein